MGGSPPAPGLNLRDRFPGQCYGEWVPLGGFHNNHAFPSMNRFTGESFSDLYLENLVEF